MAVFSANLFGLFSNGNAVFICTLGSVELENQNQAHCVIIEEMQ